MIAGCLEGGIPYGWAGYWSIGRNVEYATDTWSALPPLYYVWNRYYHTQLGRWLTPDPIGLWGDRLNRGNPYSYCANQPVHCSDPSGLLTIGPVTGLPTSGGEAELSSGCPADSEIPWDMDPISGVRRIASDPHAGPNPQWLRERYLRVQRQLAALEAELAARRLAEEEAEIARLEAQIRRAIAAWGLRVYLDLLHADRRACRNMGADEAMQRKIIESGYSPWEILITGLGRTFAVIELIDAGMKGDGTTVAVILLTEVVGALLPGIGKVVAKYGRRVVGRLIVALSESAEEAGACKKVIGEMVDVVKKKADEIGGTADNAVPAGCFVAGTVVWVLDDNETHADAEERIRNGEAWRAVATPVPIEDVEVGDYVLARSERDSHAPLGFAPVVTTHSRESNEVRWLGMTVAAGDTITIGTTDCHPLWVEWSESPFPRANTSTTVVNGIDSVTCGQRPRQSGIWVSEIETATTTWTHRGWACAMDLAVGDTLALAGDERAVVTATAEGRPCTVFNLTVASAHTYFVSESAVWVHNTSRAKTPKELGEITGDAARNFGPDDIIRGADGKYHGPLPDRLPDGWTRDEMEFAAREIRESLAARREASRIHGHDQAHDLRTALEEDFLRKLTRALGG